MRHKKEMHDKGFFLCRASTNTMHDKEFLSCVKRNTQQSGLFAMRPRKSNDKLTGAQQRSVFL
jgi:hypothetical protein